jgi:hypothetical protein
LDHYNLAAKTGRELTAGMKGVYENILSRRIITNPDWVKPADDFTQAYVNELRTGVIPKAAKGKPEYVPLPTHKEFEGMLIKRDIAEGFNDLDAMPGMARQLYNAYFLSPWKTMKVLWNPIARVRDLSSNVLFNDVAGANPLSPARVDVYGKALMGMRNNSREWQEYLKQTGGSPGNLMNIDPGPILNAMNYGTGAAGNVLRVLYDPTITIKAFGKEVRNPVGRYSEFMAKSARAGDDWAKFAKFSWNLEHGMTSKEAAMDAMRTVGDYNRQTPFVKAVRDWGMPFFGWQAHALKTMGKAIIDHPVRTAKYFATPSLVGMYAMEELNVSEEEFDQFKATLDPYVKTTAFGMPTHIPLPYRDEQGRIQMMDIGWWLPGLQDVAEIGQSAVESPVGFIQNPALTLFSAIKENKRFSGAPIYYEWEDAATKSSKIMHYVYQQMTPNWAPGNNVWMKTYDALSTNPNRPTVGQAVGPMLGYRVKGFSEGQSSSKHHMLIDTWHQQANSQMNRELQQNMDNPAKQEEIRTYYQKVFQDIERKRKEGR